MTEITLNTDFITMILYGNFFVMGVTLIVLGILLFITVQTSMRSKELKKEFKILDKEIEDLFKMRLEDASEIREEREKNKCA